MYPFPFWEDTCPKFESKFTYFSSKQKYWCIKCNLNFLLQHQNELNLKVGMIYDFTMRLIWNEGNKSGIIWKFENMLLTLDIRESAVFLAIHLNISNWILYHLNVRIGVQTGDQLTPEVTFYYNTMVTHCQLVVTSNTLRTHNTTS